MKILVNNSFSQLTDVTAIQLNAFNEELAVKTITYGYCYLKRLPTGIVSAKGSLWIKDAKGENRALTNRGFKRYKTVEEVDEAFRRKSPVIYRGWIKNHRPLIDSKGNFPTGLLKRVLAVCATKRWSFEVKDLRVKPAAVQTTILRAKYPHVPYDEQREAAMACSAAARGIVVASTGVGKSLIISQIIANLQLKTLIVVPTVELREQLRTSIEQVFGKTDRIQVTNIHRAERYAGMDFDCLIIDEFHHAASATYQKMNATAWKNIYYRFGVTATPFRNDESEDILLEGILADVIYDLPYAKAVDKGYIVPLEAYTVDVPVTDNVQGVTWAEVYDELVVTNEKRNELIAKMLLNLKTQDESVLCIVKEIEHGQRLSALTGIPFANGQDGVASELIRNFNERKITALIGTQGVLGEGVDTKPAAWVILAGLGKSTPATMQAIGRCFRKYPGKQVGRVVLLKDRSHRWTLNHHTEQAKILKEQYGITPVKLGGL